MLHFAIFPTPVGGCGIVWHDGFVAGLQLPEGGEDDTRRRIVRRFPDAVEAAAPPAIGEAPTGIGEAIAGIGALLSGAPADLSFIPLDMSRVGDFERRVYGVVRAIPPGETMTYGAVAEAMGEPGAARAVGRALGANPFPIVVPCHRVLGADGRLVGFSAHGGVETKLLMLSIEKARIGEAPALFGDLPFAAKPPR